MPVPTKLKALLVGTVLSCALAACRSEGLWSGAAFRSDGSLQVAAEEPVCGCLTLTNRTAQRVFIRSQLRGSTSGGAAINPQQARRFRFDWAGPRPEDYYIIDASDEQGNDVDMASVFDMEARPVDCESPTCIYDTLLLNVAVAEQ